MSEGDFLANTSRALLFLFALLSLVMASCGPNEAEVEATLTQAAQEFEETQIAAA